MHEPPNVNAMLQLTRDVQARITRLAANGIEPGSSLDQAFLTNGVEVVADYLSHREWGSAFEHMLYMITEPPISLNNKQLDIVLKTAAHLDHPGNWTIVAIRQAVTIITTEHQ